MNQIKMLLGIVVMASALGGCNDSAKKNENALLTENRGLRDRLTQAQSDLQTAQDDNRRLKYQLDETNQQMADFQAQPPQELTAFGPGVEVFQRGDEVIVRIEGDVLFDSGRDKLRTTAKSTLAKIATEIAREYPGSKIRVTGFTDTDPIKKSGYKSNYHLGFARAYAVGQYLGDKGISNNQISYSSFGPQMPLDTKARSRRVEVSVFTD
ncbi:MAG: OmpA family protein [Phycisphaerales bacterium]|nr:OmpA family protein [Phycisphaerales bacterium]